MPIAMTQEQRALQESLRDWAKRASPVTLVRDGSVGAIPKGLAELGLLDIPREGTLADVAAALEELAIAMTPGPVLPALLAAVLREPRATVALTPGTLEATQHPDGTLRVSGETAPLLWSGPDLLTPAAAADGDAWISLATICQASWSPCSPPDPPPNRPCARRRCLRHHPAGPGAGLILWLCPARTLRRDPVRCPRLAGAAACCARRRPLPGRQGSPAAQFGPLDIRGQLQAAEILPCHDGLLGERAAALADAGGMRTEGIASRHRAGCCVGLAALALDDVVENASYRIQVLGEHRLHLGTLDAHLYLRREPGAPRRTRG